MAFKETKGLALLLGYWAKRPTNPAENRNNIYDKQFFVMETNAPATIPIPTFLGTIGESQQSFMAKTGSKTLPTGTLESSQLPACKAWAAQGGAIAPAKTLPGLGTNTQELTDQRLPLEVSRILKPTVEHPPKENDSMTIKKVAHFFFRTLRYG